MCHVAVEALGRGEGGGEAPPAGLGDTNAAEAVRNVVEMVICLFRRCSLSSLLHQFGRLQKEQVLRRIICAGFVYWDGVVGMLVISFSYATTLS